MTIGTAVSTFVDILRARACDQPDREACTYLADDGDGEERLSYAELDERARRIATELSASVPPGERAILLFPPGLDYVAAFFGCLYANVTAVPAYPPLTPRQAPRLAALVADARPAAVLTTKGFVEYGQGLLDDALGTQPVPWLATDAVVGRPDDWAPPAVDADDVAFLQYTSGSTGNPKGVLVRHGNLVHNSAFIAERFAHTPDSRGLIWLPPYHDMGLIGGILQPVYAGFPVTLMSPVRFLRDPVGWLRAVSGWRATTSGGPNFAYDLCVRKLDPATVEQLDLSAWRVAFTGAEPIRKGTVVRFVEALAPAGLRPEAFFPCYGLAEATLMVTGVDLDEPVAVAEVSAAALRAGHATDPVDGEPVRALVACGRPAPDQTLLVVDPLTRLPVPEGVVGEIWLTGPSVAGQYWNDREQTEMVFGAVRADAPDGLRFLRTGDLGLLRAGQLFLIGRSKDLIIIRGRNYAPEDIEMSAAAADTRLRPGGGAAFGIEVGDEDVLAVVHELRPGALEESSLDAETLAVEIEQIAAAIRRTVTGEHGLGVHTVVVLRPGSLPKTSSGKVQRNECRRALLAGELAVVGASRQAPLGAAIRAAAVRVLGVSDRGFDDGRPLTEVGLDSVKAVELSADVERATGLRLPLAELLGGGGVNDLVRLAAPGPERDDGGGAGASGELTDGERAMWFLHQLDPRSTAYHLCHAVDVDGRLEPERLARALATVAGRHPALRTRFQVVDGRPVRDSSGPEPRVETVEARGWSEAQIDDDVAALAGTPFRLDVDPLWRLRHYRRDGQGGDVLALCVHHIVADLWSLTLVVDHLLVAYTDPTALDSAPPAPDLTALAHRQQAYLSSPEGQRELDRWRARLSDLPGVINLPTDRPHPPVQTSSGAAHDLVHGPEVGSAITALARQCGTTPYAVLLASFGWLLRRYTGERDIVVGTPTPGRLDPDSQGTVGLLVNAVPVRLDVLDDEPFSGAVRRAGAATREALAGQGVPFSRLVALVGPEREASRNPLFQVMFVLQQAPGTGQIASFGLGSGQLRIAGLTLTPRITPPAGPQIDLTVEVAVEDTGALQCRLTYNSDLFNPDTIEQFGRHWAQLLDAAMAQPQQTLDQLPPPPRDERLRPDGNAEREPFTPDLLTDGLTRWGAASPGATALDDGRTRLTYAELEARTARLAAALIAAGSGAESRVGVLLPRTADFVVAVLGVLRSGAAYVPLDPSHPADRLAYIGDDAGIGALVTSRSEQAQVPVLEPGEVLGGRPVTVVDIEAALDGSLEPPSGLRPSVRPQNLAYLMYTSGSTGRPKGVSSTHLGVANLLQGLDRTAALGCEDRCSWWTSGGFDVSVYEIFSALRAGATLLVVPEAVRPHPERFVDWLADNEVTSAYVPPFALSALAERAESAAAPALALRRLVVSVEPIPEPLLRRILAAVPGVRVINAYGPTETTIFSTVHDVDPDSDSDGITPLGRPLPNGPVYLLDERDRPVPIGVPGELYIGGVGLARGYHGKPARTAEVFRPDPFGWTAGGRMYATGDLARYRPDALLQFLGRRDSQVKVRGVRVELGEIEAVLAGHPSVRSALVLSRPVNGVPGLVGYVESDGTAAEPELLAHLRRALPAAMVPAAVLTMRAWPVTVNGKLDRRALPDPDERAVAEYEGPQGDLEGAVAEAWSEQFGGRRIGRRDDFFALGGHSLLAARTALLLGGRLGVEVPVALFFTHPTLADLAGELGLLIADRTGGAPITALPRAGQGVEDLIARIEDLPPDVVAALLAQYAGEGDPGTRDQAGQDSGSQP